ncbi:DUF4142 domain-containing protein [Microvirga roseola]|uniref:DUF4142 domain-containing protein n=1 Tax=Microvirga roseola TaxID=2883126 RepID=UPI001E6376E7|nr:DUF4142 domain-containing protein [Microvirga roseola]
MNAKIALVASALALGVAGCMTPTASTPPAVTAVSTAEFVPTAVSSNLFEIRSSQLALRRSRDPQVRRFAQQMIRDHNLATRRMVAVMRRAGLPRPPLALNARHQEMLASLTAAPNFDAAYLGAQTVAHQEAVGLFSAYARTGDNPALVEFAGATVPVLEMHLNEVQALGGAAVARAM